MVEARLLANVVSRERVVDATRSLHRHRGTAGGRAWDPEDILNRLTVPLQPLR